MTIPDHDWLAAARARLEAREAYAQDRAVNFGASTITGWALYRAGAHREKTTEELRAFIQRAEMGKD